MRALLRDEPWRFNFFRLFREYERANRSKPRIGRNIVTREEYLRVGQDPSLGFPTSNITGLTEGADGKPDSIRVRFLSYFGPQGALPVSTTEEVIAWQDKKNEAFIRFADIFGGRFYHILYRAWASSRRISQFDRPAEDRFQTYLGALGGVPLRAREDRPDSLSTLARLDVAGLLGGRVRSPNRLQQIIETVLRVDADVEEFIPLWISFEEEDRSKLGQRGSSLGMDLRLGSRVQTVSDKVRINIRTQGGADYDRFLPGRPGFVALTDLARGYLGPTVDIEIAPSMPAKSLPAVRLGQIGAVGHTSWIAPKKPKDENAQIQSAVFLFSAFKSDPNEERPRSAATEKRETVH